MTDTANINTGLEDAPSPPGANEKTPKLKQEAGFNSDDSSESEDNGVDVTLTKNAGASNQPFNLLHDPSQSSMAKVLAGQVPDTSNNTIVNKPQVNSKAPNVQVQGEASASVYRAFRKKLES